MSTSRIAAAMLALSTATAFAADHVNCPRMVMTAEGAVHTLSDARVFQDSPSKKVEIKPVHGYFDVGAAMGTGGADTFDLVCIYGGTTDTQTLAVPRTATACTVADAGSGTVASCH